MISLFYVVTKQPQNNKFFDTYLADINKSDNTHDKHITCMSMSSALSPALDNIIIIPGSQGQLSFSYYHLVSVVV